MMEASREATGVTRTLVTDPRTGERAVKVEIDANANTPEAGQAIRELIMQASSKGQIDLFRRRAEALGDDASPERERALQALDRAETARQKRDILGVEAFLRDAATLIAHGEMVCNPDRISGRKTREGGRRGNEMAHGTKAEREAEWAGWQEYLDRLYQENPTKNHEWRLKKAMTEFGVKKTALKAHTQNPAPRRCKK